jgi:outer membrane protein insertion porin family
MNFDSQKAMARALSVYRHRRCTDALCRLDLKPVSTMFAALLLVWAWTGCFTRPALAIDHATPAPSVEMLNVTGVAVEMVPAGHSSESLQRLAEAMIRATDRRFSAEDIDRTVARLKSTGLFAAIHVDTRPDPSGTVLLFRLTPFGLIKEISFDGAFPLLEDNILRVMTIAVGSPFVENDLPRQERFIAQLYRHNGFISPGVSIIGEKDSGDGNFILHIQIDRGPAYRLDKIILDGNKAISTLRLNTHLRNWQPAFGFLRQRRFIENELQGTLKTLRQFYRKNFYPEVRLSSQVDKNDQTGQVQIRVTIDEGPRYVVNFHGNSVFSDRVLKKDLVFLHRGIRGDARFQKSIDQITQRYHRAGCSQAQIAIKSEEAVEENLPVRRVIFDIDEGPRQLINSFRLEGNHHLTARDLQNEINAFPIGRAMPRRRPFVAETLNADVERIKQRYVREGFLNVKLQENLVKNADETSVDVVLDIIEGPRAIVAEVNINGLPAKKRKQAYVRFPLQPLQPFNPNDLRKGEKHLTALLSGQGHLYAKVTGRYDISADAQEVKIDYDVTQGPLVRVGDLFFTGNFRTRTAFLKQILNLGTGEAFSSQKLMRAQRDLRNLPFLSGAQVKAIGLKEQLSTVTVIVGINERKPYFVEAGAGYESERGFFINGQLGDINLWGRGQRGRIAGEVSQVGYQFEGSVTDPRLFNTPLMLTTGLFGKREEAFNVDFGVDSFGAYLNLGHDKWDALLLSLNTALARIDQYKRSSFDASTSTIDESEFEPRSSLTVRPTIVFDMRDSAIRPHKGIFSSLAVEVSRALENDLDNIFILNGDLRFFISPTDQLTFAALGRVGHAEPYDTTVTIPQDKLFYLGGVASVRGYEENLLYFGQKGKAVGGRSSINTSLEARYVFDNNLELSVFIDGGQITDLERKSEVDGWRSSVGLGLRYVTPIGPVGILYGHKLDRAPGESPGRFHFSFGYTF